MDAIHDAAEKGWQIGDDVEILLVSGQRLQGELRALDGDWIGLACAQGAARIRTCQAAVIAAPGVLTELSELSEPGVASEAGAGPGSSPKRSRGGPGRPWQDDDLRLLANAFLDGITDRELAQEFGRTAAVIKHLRQGFECARGNLVEDQIGEIAQTWVYRWQRLLSPD